MANVLYDSNADLKWLQGKTVAVLGYGSQGHAQAQNLRDSGVKVIVGLRPGSLSWKAAEQDGFEVMTVAEACQQAQVIHMLLPDEVQRSVYEKDVRQYLQEGNALSFSHGFNIHFKQIVPPPNVDVFMLAPKAPGHTVRRQYVAGAGVPGLFAVYQDATGNARDLALAFAKGVGCTRAGVIETTFQEETETDLFGEQVVLCGGLTELVRSGFETLVEAGYQPEIAYFECLHEMKLIVDLMYEGGISWMRYSISDTAEYGDLTRGPRVINEQSKQEMKKILSEIQNGEFARDWILENQAGRPSYLAMRTRQSQHLIEKTGRQLRSMMTWLAETNEKAQQELRERGLISGE